MFEEHFLPKKIRKNSLKHKKVNDTKILSINKIVG